VGMLGVEAEEERSGQRVKRGGQQQGHWIIAGFVIRIVPDEFPPFRSDAVPG
jgi:hypothetical protein